MNFLDFKDTVSGNEGTAFITIGGQNLDLFYVKAIEATIEKEKAEGKTLGRRGMQSKATGYKGTGELKIYYVTPLFVELIMKYMKDGIDTYFDLTVVNEDPNSQAGKQTVVLKNCNLDEVPVALLDVESEALEQEMSFTFDDMDILDKFKY